MSNTAWQHWNHLCKKIGDRRAGSPGEEQAARYIVEQFVATGLCQSHIEPFPCKTVLESEAIITVRRRGKLQDLPARVLAGSPGTPGSRPVEADLVWIEMPEQAGRLHDSSLRGRIAVLFGPMPTRADLHRRLVRAKPAAVLHVDDRLPFEWMKDDGVYPTWVRRYGMPPTAALPFRVAWELRKEGINRARVQIKVRLGAARSQNVIGEIQGSDPRLPMLVLGAHHDTQCHSCGADDNASAVVALLELAPRLASARLRRTIRLIAFGAEEQLSLGSAVYAREHRAEMPMVGAVLNMDSVTSFLGHHWMIRAGTDRFGQWMTQALARAGLEVIDKPAPMPFADHFPFSVFGVPAITLYRPNMDSGMRWQHHSHHDNLRNVSMPELQRVVNAVHKVTLILANQARLPFPRGLAPACRAETARLARDLFDLRMNA
jgi:hypothetical protein